MEYTLIVLFKKNVGLYMRDWNFIWIPFVRGLSVIYILFLYSPNTFFVQKKENLLCISPKTLLHYCLLCTWGLWNNSTNGSWLNTWLTEPQRPPIHRCRHLHRCWWHLCRQWCPSGYSDYSGVTILSQLSYFLLENHKQHNFSFSLFLFLSRWFYLWGFK